MTVCDGLQKGGADEAALQVLGLASGGWTEGAMGRYGTEMQRGALVTTGTQGRSWSQSEKAGVGLFVGREGEGSKSVNVSEVAWSGSLKKGERRDGLERGRQTH